MYESEVNHTTESIDSIPREIAARFSEYTARVSGRSLLPWGEHCTECNWPHCYTSCDLYTRRPDGGCRLFVGGMIRIDQDGALNPYLLKIRFKRWGKLWCIGSTKLYPQATAARKERHNMLLGAAARALPLPFPLKSRVLTKVAYRRRLETEQSVAAGDMPDYFLIECFNPNPGTITLTLTVRPRFERSLQPFIRRLDLSPGFNRHQLSAVDISRQTDLRKPFEVEMVPNECDNTVLYFGCLDFVKEVKSAPASSSSPVAKWKCVVWDLDNTLWSGVLLEDGPDKLRINPAAVSVIKELDRRGILQSIASKNNQEDALGVLRAAGLEEYFLHPQVGWKPKSEALERIAKQLNIGLDTLAFVDDQQFEREEVKTALPQVSVVDAIHCAELTNYPECDVPVTSESQQRRALYRQQAQRESVLEAYQGDYIKFLRDCSIQLTLERLDSTNLERVYELAQRTNQMNFSGRRYPREDLAAFAASGAHETYVMRCTDRFGSYGIVGFALVDTSEPRLMDLMFSCRIQSKRVEHAFLTFLLNRFVKQSNRPLFASYHPTPKNEPSGKVFDEMGFVRISEMDGMCSLKFDASTKIPDDGIIRVSTPAGW